MIGDSYTMALVRACDYIIITIIIMIKIIIMIIIMIIIIVILM